MSPGTVALYLFSIFVFLFKIYSGTDGCHDKIQTDSINDYQILGNPKLENFKLEKYI